MMLPETGAKTDGLCMRCYGTPRDAYRIKQRYSPPATIKTRKASGNLTESDLKAFPVWISCSADDDKVRPVSSRGLPEVCEAVVATTFKFADGSEHSGAVVVMLLGETFEFAEPFLLRPGERIDFSDSRPQFTYQKISPSLAEGLRRNFLQNLTRVERQIGRPLAQVFPMNFDLQSPLREGQPRLTGAFPMPEFKLPNVVGDEV
jgi:hypothetical protein